MSLNFIHPFPGQLNRSALSNSSSTPQSLNKKSSIICIHKIKVQVPRLSRREAIISFASLVGFAPFFKPEKTVAAWRPRDPEVLYDNKSGSFVPTSAIDLLFKRDAGESFDRCIVAGEIHDNILTHNAQLTVIDSARRLTDGKKLQVGFEQFYRAHNPFLDAYVHGQISTDELLKRTNWDYVWGFEPALYIPIFEYCRYHQIPMRGLNVPRPFASYIGRVGFDEMDDRLKEFLPDNMDRNNIKHFEHFVSLFLGGHGMSDSIDMNMIKRYYDVQVLWEEWMSQSVAMSLNESPDIRMVALIGSGHVEGRFGFPDRIEKRCNERPYTIVPRPVAWDREEGYEMPSIQQPERNVADLLWYTKRKVDLV